MAFPSSIPSYTGFTSSHTLSQDNHASQHNSEQADIIAIATKIGTGASTPTSGTILRGNGSGTSTWDTVHMSSDVQGVLGTNNGGTGQTNLSGLTLPSATTSNPTISGTVSGSATYSTPTLTVPVISDFTSANHDHSSTSKGGSLGAVTATSLTTNTLSANGANNITLSAGTNKLVKTTVLRQDDTTNTYEVGNSVVLTGWGVITPGVSGAASEAVTFGVTFLQRPIVVCTTGGDATSSTNYGDGGFNIKKITTEAVGILTTGFTVVMLTVDSSSWSAGNTVFYQWIAIGEI